MYGAVNYYTLYSLQASSEEKYIIYNLFLYSLLFNDISSCKEMREKAYGETCEGTMA